MDNQTTTQAPPLSSNSQPAAAKGAGQAVTGVMPPDLGEATIREAWPGFAAGNAAFGGLLQKLTATILLAPIAWLVLAPMFLLVRVVLAPVLTRRYTLTNRRIMVRKGFFPKAKPVEEIPLKAIDDVRLVEASKNAFYRCADLEVWSEGKMALKLPAVPEAESFRRAIINAYKAWVPGKADNAAFVPASAAKA
jgi:hypothetical protein